MNRQSHIMIARMVSGYVQRQYGIRLLEKSFFLGSVLPDYLPSFLYRPHFLRFNRSHILRIIRSLLQKSASARSGRHYSLLSGILCHFYADSFCYAHTPQFDGGLRLHLLYEERLNRCLLEQVPEILASRFVVRPERDSDAESIWNRFMALQAAYQNASPSPNHDLIYSVQACIEAIVLIAASAETGDLTGESPIRLQAIS